MIQYSSSLRERSIPETLEIARKIAPTVGLTRVTDTTRLDRVGVPVFASIRPDADVGGLCVNAGKGLRTEEAQIGAYMESIELAFAEMRRARVEVFAASAGDALDSATGFDAIKDFIPSPHLSIRRSTLLDCVRATDLRTGGSVIVPVERVLFPIMQPIHAERLYFGSDGNGIASGNTLDEAVVHALTEVIERDVYSFQNVHDTSQLIYTTALDRSIQAKATPSGAPLRDELPPALREVIERLDAAGFDVWLRHQPNGFGLPVIRAVLAERGTDNYHFGAGCHLLRDIALARAFCEAAQSRLTYIHGGRDDLLSMNAMVNLTNPESRAEVAGVRRQLAAHERFGVVSWSDVPDAAGEFTDLRSALALLLRRMADNGLPGALYVQLGPADLPITVVRALVPGAEMFAHGIFRVGSRLDRFMKEHAVGKVNTNDTAR